MAYCWNRPSHVHHNFWYICMSEEQKSSVKFSANENKLLLAFEWLFRENLPFKTTLRIHEMSEGASVDGI